jgi:DMSO reductase anchor subunit
VGVLPPQEPHFYVLGSVISLALLAGGLLASFFHLGHPERAWRSAARWRTSWLSREVIVLPMMMGLVFLFGLAHYLNLDLRRFGVHSGVPGDLTLLIGTAGAITAFGLFLCTAMIYACIKFLQEWASPLTVINYTLLGGASGFTLATAFAAAGAAPDLSGFFGGWAIGLTALAAMTRGASLIRNARIKHRSTLQSAIGVRHSRIRQTSQGLMGGSFNTREFFHGVPVWAFRSIKWVFLVLVFPVPVALLAAGLSAHTPWLFAAAFVVQYAGLLAERWYFFAQSNHPQNLYYQVVS